MLKMWLIKSSFSDTKVSLTPIGDSFCKVHTVKLCRLARVCRRTRNAQQWFSSLPSRTVLYAASSLFRRLSRQCSKRAKPTTTSQCHHSRSQTPGSGGNNNHHHQQQSLPCGGNHTYLSRTSITSSSTTTTTMRRKSMSDDDATAKLYWQAADRVRLKLKKADDDIALNAEYDVGPLPDDLTLLDDDDDPITNASFLGIQQHFSIEYNGTRYYFNDPIQDRPKNEPAVAGPIAVAGPPAAQFQNQQLEKLESLALKSHEMQQQEQQQPSGVIQSTLPSCRVTFVLDTSIKSKKNNKEESLAVVTFESMPTYHELCRKLGLVGAKETERVHLYFYSKKDNQWYMLGNDVMPAAVQGGDTEYPLTLAKKRPPNSPEAGVMDCASSRKTQLPHDDLKTIVRSMFQQVEANADIRIDLQIEEWKQKQFEGDIVKEGVMSSVENESAPDLNLHCLEKKLSSLTEKILALINSDGMYNLALIGVSGCGKTRTIHEVLAKVFGLYFVCNTSGNRGSGDMVAALRDIHISARKEGRDIKDDVEKRTKEARKIMGRLAEGRLHIFQRVQGIFKAKNKSLTPRDWLLMQLFPKRWFGRDIFWDLYKSDRDIPGAASLQDNNKWPQVVFIDEAQICDRKDEYGCFLPAKQTLVGEKDNQRRTVLSPFILELGSFGSMDVVVAGTGLGLKSTMETTRSAVAALTAAGMEKNFEVLTDFDRTETTDDVKMYLGRIISESVLNLLPLDSILELVQGRKRFLAALAQKLVLNKGSWTQTRRDFLSFMMDENSDESIAHHVKKVLNSQMSCSFRALAVASSMTVERPVLAEEDYELINAGVCFLSKNAKKDFIGTIDEPIVLSVLWSYHAEQVWGKSLNFIALDPRFQDASSLGFFAQAYIIPCVRKYVSEFDFASVSGIPEWIKEGVPFGGDKPKIISHNEGPINFGTYLGQSPNNNTFRPDVFNHADFAESFCPKNSNKKHLCTGHVKLWKSDANFGDEFEEAIESTCVENMYTKKKGGEICKELREQVMTCLKKEYGEGILRIVVTHPAPPGSRCRVKNKDIILFIALTEIIPTNDKLILDTLQTALKSCSCSQRGLNCATKRCGCKWRQEKCNSGCHPGNAHCTNPPLLDDKKRKASL